MDGQGVNFDTPNLPRLNPDSLPAWVGIYARALATATETPLELAAGLTLATIAAAVARRFRLMVRPGYFEPLNLWVAVALPPSNRKSAVQSAATAPLLSWERAEAAHLADSVTAATSARKTAEARAASLRAKAGRTADEMLARDYAAQVATIEANLPDVLRVPQLWTSDATPERLGMLLADNAETMAWLSSEGGVFDLLNGRYSNGIPNLDLVLKAHSGDSERVDRAGRPPVFLERPLLTIGLSPQPEVLRGLSEKPGFQGRGLLARFLYFLPTSPLGYRALTSPRIPDAAIQAYEAGIHAILNVSPVVKEDGQTHPHLLRLSADAHSEWLDFARHIELGMRPGGTLEHLTDWAGKAPGLAARIAGVFHVVETVMTDAWQEEIPLATMTRALDHMAVATAHARQAFDLMGSDHRLASARRVWDWIEAGRRKRFSERDGWQALKGSFPRMTDLRDAFDSLEERGYVRTIIRPSEGGRPPSPTVVVRPGMWRI